MEFEKCYFVKKYLKNADLVDFSKVSFKKDEFNSEDFIENFTNFLKFRPFFYSNF